MKKVADLDETQTRIFRITGGKFPAVEYGWWSTTASSRRFEVVRRWPVSDAAQAKTRLEECRAMLFCELDGELLPGVDAKALPSRNLIRRDWAAAPGDIVDLVNRAREALEVEDLPAIEESHRRLKADVPAPHGAGRQFYVYLAEPIYQKLVAMAAAAQVTRNRMIEGLVLSVAMITKEKKDG